MSRATRTPPGGTHAWTSTTGTAALGSGTVGDGAYTSAVPAAPFPDAGFRRFEAADLGT